MTDKRHVVVLRLGHRPFRDKRITTHVGLVARAFGADGLILAVDDQSIVRSVLDVSDRWGGDFYVKIVSDWRGFVKAFSGVVVHLTMYGASIDDKIVGIRSSLGDVLVIVGAEKVPPEIYDLSDYNVSIGSQPHSEVAALAVFLDRFFDGEELNKDFKGRMSIIPSGKGKKIITE